MPFRRGLVDNGKRSKFVPEGLALAFADEFDGPLSVESGTLPGTGETWADAFVQFGTRSLPANNDEALKGRPGYSNSGGPTFESLGLHTMQQQGSSLILAAHEIPAANRPQFFNFPYAAPHLDSRRSCNFAYGYIEIRARCVTLGAGMHWTLAWLWAGDSNDFEIDLVEIIGSNSFSPNGPINSMFFNSHDNRAGSGHSATYPITQHNQGRQDMLAWHTYGVEITTDTVTWYLDGVQRRQIPNVFPTGTPWHVFLGTCEMGESPSGDFPGPVNATTKFPNYAEIDYIRVYTEDGTLLPEPALPGSSGALPVANDDTATAEAGGPAITIDALANDTGFNLSIANASVTTGIGSAVIANDEISYTPPAVAGNEVITYQITDGTNVDSGSVAVTVAESDNTQQGDETLSFEAFASGLGDWSSPGVNDPAPGSWTHLATATNTGSTGPAGGAAPTTLIPTDGFGFAYTETSPAGGAATFSLESIPLDASLGTISLTFAFHMRFGNGSLTDGSLRVQGWNGTAWSDIGPVITGSQQAGAADPFLRSSSVGAYDSTGFNNTDFRFRFLAARGAGDGTFPDFNYDTAVDSIEIIGPTGAGSGASTGGGSGGSGAAVGIIHEFSGADGVDAWPGPTNMTTPEAAHSRANVSSPASRVFAGSQSLQYEIRPGDPKWSGDLSASSQKRRVEMSGSPWRFAHNQEGWFGAAFYLPSAPMATIGGCTIFQLHCFPDFHEILQVSLFNGQMQFVTDGPSTNFVAGQVNLATQQGGLLDRWVRYVCNFRSSTGGDGFINIFLDDVQVLAYSGPTKPNGTQGPYGKFGTYFWGSNGNQPAICLYDNIRFGDETSDFASVNPANFPRTD